MLLLRAGASTTALLLELSNEWNAINGLEPSMESCKKRLPMSFLVLQSSTIYTM